MEIIKISPQGYCKGVVMPLRTVVQALKEPNTPRPIQMLGMVIHNKRVSHALEQLGLIVIEQKGETRLTLLERITEGTVIFSAHGVSPKVMERAKEKNLHIIDATCPDVKKVHIQVIEKLQEGYTVLYAGTAGHPECEGVLGISDKIHFIHEEADMQKISTSSKFYLTNQTTLSNFELDHLFYKAKQLFPNIEIESKICLATTLRQRALQSLTADLCIVVGDKLSSNTKNLVKIASHNTKTILLEDLSDLLLEDLIGINSVAITSGASTPRALVGEIVGYLSEYDETNQKEPKSILNDSDLLTL